MLLGLPLAAVCFTICATVQAGVIPNRANNHVVPGNDNVQVKEGYNHPEVQGNVAGYKIVVDTVGTVTCLAEAPSTLTELAADPMTVTDPAALLDPTGAAFGCLAV